MKAKQIDIYPENSMIVISQDDPYGEEPCLISITPEQAELVCQWIMVASRTIKFEDSNKQTVL